MDLLELMKAAATFLLRPPAHVVMRSATPQDSSKQNVSANHYAKLKKKNLPKYVSV